MAARRLTSMILAVWFMPAAPAAASVAEHEPARGALFLGVVFIAAISWVMACRRWWLPLVIWPPLALAASGFIAHLLDPAIGAAIWNELGADYVIEADLCIALAVVVPLMLANMRMSRQD